MEQMSSQSIVIAGGGTGGHLYPALSICEVIKKREPQTNIHFVGTAKGLEVDIVPRSGYKLELIKVGTLKGTGVFSKIKTLLGIPSAIFQSIQILRRLNPRVVLGVGGYASGPVMLAASLLRIPRVLFEPNAFPGLTNRWLAKFVNHAFITFSAAQKFFRPDKTTLVGLPVRGALKPVAREGHQKLRILIFGGSQGALGVNNTVIKAVEDAAATRASWLEQAEIVHQTGKVHFANLHDRYGKLRLSQIEVTEFIHDMDRRYAWADVVVCRSGASTLQELACCHKAAVLIPFPFASDDHQKKNAEAYSEKEAAILVVQKDFTPEKFVSIIQDFLEHREKITELEERIAPFYVPNSAEKIAQALLERPRL